MELYALSLLVFHFAEVIRGKQESRTVNALGGSIGGIFLRKVLTNGIIRYKMEEIK